MINLNNCKEGDRLKNRAGYDCTYSYKADNKHIVRLLNLTSYYVDDHGFVAKGSPQYMDDIIQICKHDNIQGDLFKNIPEGVTELVHNGKRYIKRTVTKTQWEEVL